MDAGPTFPRDRAAAIARDHVTVIAVLNVTPDSFSDGGRFVGVEGEPRLAEAVAAARDLERAGAHVIDVGGESTRPGAGETPAEVEIARTAPVIAALARATPLPISIDTRKAAVARVALDAGAGIVNDVTGLRFDPELAEVAAAGGATLILGHLRGAPATMQRDVSFGDVLDEVGSELERSVEAAVRAGVARDRIVVDPGIGFGKRLEQNLALLAGVALLRARLELPVLVGPSRKSFLGKLTGDPVEDREAATHAACAVAIFQGADAIRVHDAAGGARVAAVARALRAARAGSAA